MQTSPVTGKEPSTLAKISARVAILVMVAGLGVAVFCAPGYLCCASAASNPPALASAKNLKPLLERLQRHYQQTDSFSAKFNETVTRVGAPPRDRTGVVYYRKPGRIRFDFGEPQPETIVSDGTTLYDYDPGLNQVVQAPLRQAFTTQRAAALLLGAGNVEHDFSAATVANSPVDGLEHVALMPKGGGDRIELGLDPKTSNIKWLGLTDALGNVTTFRFSEIQRNLPLKSSLFVFIAPAGADIVSSQNSR